MVVVVVVGRMIPVGDSILPTMCASINHFIIIVIITSHRMAPFPYVYYNCFNFTFFYHYFIPLTSVDSSQFISVPNFTKLLLFLELKQII